MTVLANEISGKVGGRGLRWESLDTAGTGLTPEMRAEQKEGRVWNPKLMPCLLPCRTGKVLVVHSRLSRGFSHLQHKTTRGTTSKMAIRREVVTSQSPALLWNTPEPLHRIKSGLVP